MNVYSSMPVLRFSRINLSNQLRELALSEILNWSRVACVITEKKYQDAYARYGVRSKLVVDVSEQTAYLQRENGCKLFTIATGDPRKGRAMSYTVWRVASKRDQGLAPLYGPRLLMLDRRTPSGIFVKTFIALHGTNQPEILGEPRSLGCIYFHNRDILGIYDLLKVGDLVATIP